MKNMQLLSEHLRPKEFADLIQPLGIIRRFEAMVARGEPRNLLFYGEPGLGKTSAARLLLTKLGDNFFEINGSLRTGIEDIRDIEVAANSLGLGDGPRMCFIDEAEYLSRNAQAGLRGLIERSHCRFILTANDISKFHPALKSRCMPVCFDTRSGEAAAIITRLVPRYMHALTTEDIMIREERLKELMAIYFPDLRGLANRIEFEAIDCD